MFFGTRLSFFKHTDFTDLTDFELLMFEHEFYESECFLAHGSHRSHGFRAFGSL